MTREEQILAALDKPKRLQPLVELLCEEGFGPFALADLLGKMKADRKLTWVDNWVDKNEGAPRWCRP